MSMINHTITNTSGFVNYNHTITNTLGFVNYNKIKSILLISNYFNLPHDISENIYFHLLNVSTQKIINYWYNHISIHNTNLCELVCKLQLKHGFYENTHVYYYDLHDINVLKTFKICYKMLDFNCSSFPWWNDTIKIAMNGMYFQDKNLNQDIFNESCNVIRSLKIKYGLALHNILCRPFCIFA
jgi:hypothetical protein